MSVRWTALAVGVIAGVALSYILNGKAGMFGGKRFGQGEQAPTDQNKRAGFA